MPLLADYFVLSGSDAGNSRPRASAFKSRMQPVLVIICLPPLLGGCVLHETYGDPTVPDSELAVLEGYWHYFLIYDEDMQIASVDYEQARQDAWFNAYSASLPPGSHRLEVAISRNGTEIAACTFNWTFEAQHHYKMTGLQHHQLALAHPSTPVYEAAISVTVTAPTEQEQVLAIPATCSQ